MQLTRYFSRVAASFARIQVMLKGLDSDVDQVGIMTAWNPNAQRMSRDANHKANRELLSDLRDRGYGPIKIGGHFEHIPEGSFLIPHMERGFLISLCGKYNQWSVIYGKKYESDDGGKAFIFEMLGPDGEQRASKETVILTSTYQEPGHRDINKEQSGFSFFGGDEPGESKRPVPPNPKRFKIPFRFAPEDE